MFDRTKHLLIQTINDVKSIAKFFTIFVQIVYMAYLVYAIIANTGIRAVNGVLLLLALAYFIFYLVVSETVKVTNKDERKEARSKLKKARRFYQRSKILINVFPLGVSIYSICLTASDLNPFTLLSTVFMIFSWALQIFIQIVVSVVEKRYHLFEEAFAADVNDIKEPFTKPIRETGNFIRRVFGKEEVPTPEKAEPSKALLKIEEALESKKQAQLEERAQAKQKRREVRQAKRAEKKRFKTSAKKEKELLKTNTSSVEPSDEGSKTDGAGTE